MGGKLQTREDVRKLTVFYFYFATINIGGGVVAEGCHVFFVKGLAHRLVKT